MKTANIVGSIAINAALVAAIGCATTGDGEHVGSTSQEVLSVTGGTTTPTAVKAPGHCVMTDSNGKQYFGLFGGFTTSSGSPTAAIQLFTVTGGWATAKLSSNHANDALLSLARGQAKATPYPGDASSCLVAGGSLTFDGKAAADNSGSGQFTVEKVTVDTGGFLTVTHSSGGNFAQLRRTRGEMKACPTGNLVFYFGGLDDNGTTGTEQSTVMKFDTSSPTTAWSNVQSMADEHVDFGLARDDSNFVVAGGKKSGGDSNLAELFKTTSSCSTWTTTTGTLAGTNTSKRGNATVLRGSHQFAVAGGFDGSSVTGDVTEFTVDWTGTNPSFSAGPSAGTALHNSAVTYRPEYLSLGNTGFVLGGQVGTSSTSNTFATDAAQETYWSSANLSTNGRFAAAAEVLNDSGTNKVYFVAGSKVVTGTETVLNTMDVITP